VVNVGVTRAALVIAVSCFAFSAWAESTDYSCVTEASKDATLSFTVSGRIAKIYHREGSSVSAGTKLVDLDRRSEELEVERRKLVFEDKSQLNAAREEAATYKDMLASTKKLFDSTGSVSREDLAKLELKANTAESEFQRLTIAEKREEVEYKLALEHLAERTLRAPFSGTIVNVKLEEGEICEANQPLIQLVDITKANLNCNIEEPVGRKLTTGEQVPISIQAGHGQWQGMGKVVFVAPVVDPASGLLRVKIEFDNKSGDVRPGVPGTVTLQSDAAADNATQAPESGDSSK